MANSDLTIIQGVTFRRVFVYQNPDGTPISLVGWRPVMNFRQRAGGLLYDDWSDNLTVEPGGATGEMHLRLGADVTQTYSRGGVYELRLVEITDPTEVLELLSGSVLLTKGVVVDGVGGAQ